MSADSVFWWANWVLIAALVVGVVATYAIVVSGNLKEAALRRELGEATATAETAKANAAAATERTASLETEAAKSRERAAALEKEAAQARLEQEQLKARLAWRVVPPEMKAKLTERLSARPSKINIEYVSTDTEAKYFAIQIANIFADAKWQIGMMQVTYGGSVFFGIDVPDSPDEGTSLVREVFAGLGIPFFTAKLPDSSAGFGNRVQTAATLLIGSKQP